MKAQITMAVLIVLGFIVAICQDGKPREPYNFYIWLCSALITNIILYWGGFWDVFLK